jgi:hypothetical protein
MAHENRFSRRMLGQQFKEFYELARQNKVRSRMLLADSNILYVFLAVRLDVDRKARAAELEMRCYVARGLHQDRQTVIGLATERYDPKNGGFSFDVAYLHMPVWGEEEQRQLKNIQEKLGYFVEPVKKSIHHDEYPASNQR